MIKRLTANKIFLWVFALLLTFPMLNIGFRCGYVMLNKNAYESYYGETINESIVNLVETNEDINLVNFYDFNIPLNTISTTDSIDFYIRDLTITGPTITNQDLIYRIRATYSSTYNRMDYTMFGTDIANQYFSSGNTINAKFRFTAKPSDTNNYWYQYLTFTTYNKYSYLDNAFDYSVNQFLEDNGNGVIQFTSLFDDMFFATQNSHTANILNYINWYMNYALFLSCSYFVFEILIFFINYARKWLYHFTEDGGK